MHGRFVHKRKISDVAVSMIKALPLSVSASLAITSDQMVDGEGSNCGRVQFSVHDLPILSIGPRISQWVVGSGYCMI